MLYTLLKEGPFNGLEAEAWEVGKVRQFIDQNDTAHLYLNEPGESAVYVGTTLPEGCELCPTPIYLDIEG